MKPASCVLALTLSALLTACAVGPNYRPPAPPSGIAPGAFVDPAAANASSAPVVTQWWRLFDDPVLDRLVGEALANNTDIRVAQANLRRSRAILSERRTDRLPTTSPSASYTRRRIGTNAVAAQGGAAAVGAVPADIDGFEFDFFQLGFDAAYEVDLFGRVSRSVEAARADTAASAAALDGARLSVAAETARTYVQACGNALQADVARETARFQDQTLDLTRTLLRAGRGTRRDVDQAEVIAENARAQVPVFEAEQRASLYALATLTGRQPSEVDVGARACRIVPAVSAAIPVGDGNALLARRPDVREAERRLAAETARIGVATAALFPSIKLASSVSLGSTDIDTLGKPASFGFSLGPLISWTFPNIGVARARIRQSRASADAALATFDGRTLTALQEVEQSLARWAGAAQARAAQRRAEAAAISAANISLLRFNEGRDSFLQRLDAERDRAAARAAAARSDLSLAEAQIALFKSLGGGWETASAAVRR